MQYYNGFWQRLYLTADDTLLPDRWPAETGWRPGSTPGRGRRVSRCAGSCGVSWGWCPGSGLERSPRRVPGPATSAPVVSQQCTARSRGRMLRTRTFACGGAITIRCGGLAHSIMSTIKKLMPTLQQYVYKTLHENSANHSFETDSQIKTYIFVLTNKLI